MNRRDFLALFRGLAALPFIKPTPHAGHYVSGNQITRSQAVAVDENQGKLEVWKGSGHIIGIAARDIAPGEVVQWVIGGNSKDIITSDLQRVEDFYNNLPPDEKHIVDEKGKL